MIKKLFTIFSFLILTGCTSLIKHTKEIPKANIIRKKDSQLAVVSVEYAADIGIKVIINNKTNRIVEILWSKSSINGETLSNLNDEWLLPNDVYTTVFQYFSENNKFTPLRLKYPLRFEIFFRNKALNDKVILIITEGELTKLKVDLFGNIIEE